MNKTWKKTVTTILAFALAAGGMMGGASYLNEVSAAEQPVAALREAGEPAEMAVDAGVYEANAGDTIKVKVRVCDIKDSFNSVGGRLLVNTEAFSVLSVTPGDTDDPDNENTEIFQKTLTAQSMCSEHTEKIGFIYCELESLKEDTVFLTIELRVNDDAKDGCYTVPFYLHDSSVSMATKIVETEDTWDVFEVNPDYRGALITVGAGSDEIIEPEEPEEYSYEYDYDNDHHLNNLDEDGVINPIIPEITYSETGQPITTACSDESLTGFTVDAGVYEAKAGDTIKVKIRATDIKQPFCGALGYFIIDEDKFTVLSAEPGDADDPDDDYADDITITKDVSLNVYRNAENSKMAVFIYSSLLENVDEDMVFATVELKVNDDVKDGNYELPFAVLEYGGMACAYDDVTDEIIYNEPEFHGALIKVSNTVEKEYAENSQPVISTHFTDDPAAFVVDAGVYEAKVGDTVKLKIKATDIKESFAAICGFLDVDTDVFEVISVEAGDTDDPYNEKSGVYINSGTNHYMSDETTETVAFVYSDRENIDKDMILATVELKVKDNAAEGCYELPFELMDNGGVMATHVDINDGFYVKSLDPEFRGALIKVSAAEETIPEEQPEITESEETPAPAEELPVIEEPEKPVGPGHHGPAGPAAPKPDHRHDHKHDHAPAPKPDDHRNDHKNSYEKAVEKIAEDITNVITDVAKFIFSLF